MSLIFSSAAIPRNHCIATNNDGLDGIRKRYYQNSGTAECTWFHHALDSSRDHLVSPNILPSAYHHCMRICIGCTCPGIIQPSALKWIILSHVIFLANWTQRLLAGNFWLNLDSKRTNVSCPELEVCFLGWILLRLWPDLRYFLRQCWPLYTYLAWVSAFLSRPDHSP